MNFQEHQRRDAMKKVVRARKQYFKALNDAARVGISNMDAKIFDEISADVANLDGDVKALNATMARMLAEKTRRPA